MTKPFIRPMAVEDLGQLARDYVDAFRDADEQWTPQAAQALLSDWLKRQPDLAFVAEVDSKLAGAFIVGIRPWWDGNHLVDGELFVAPEYQKTGVGTELVRKTIQTAIEKYAPTLWETYTFRGQDFPMDWYRRLGFREIEEWVMIRADMKDVAAFLTSCNLR